MSVSKAYSLLSKIAEAHPWLWEYLHPHVLEVATPQFTSRFGRSELNPQPLPPKELLSVAARSTAVSVAEAVIAARLAGRDSREVLSEIGDDICPEPPKFPWPRPWPFPWPPGEPYPIRPEEVASLVQAEFALVFQSYSARISDEDLSGAFGEMAERVGDAALGAG